MRNKEGHYIMIKGTIQEEGIAIIKIYASNIGAPKYIMQMLTTIKQCSKFSQPGFNSMGTKNFQMFKLDLEKAEEPESKLPTSIGSQKKQESSKSIYFCFINYVKAFDCMEHNKLWKILKEMGIPDHPTCLLRILYAGREATVRTGHGTMAG